MCAWWEVDRVFKLIRGELYRLLHKKSMYIYFGVLAVCYLLLAFVRSGGFDTESVVDDSITFFNFLPALAGGFLFSAIYTDDLNAKNLITLVGYGLGKTKIVLAKLILMLLFGAAVFGLAPLYHCGVYALLGHGATAGQLGIIYAASLKFLLLTVAYAALSGIVVYGFQRTTFAIVVYILFGFYVIRTLLTTVAKLLGLNIQNYLLSGITDRIFSGMVVGGSVVFPILEYLVYIAAAVALSALAFNKKEMEF